MRTRFVPARAARPRLPATLLALLPVVLLASCSSGASIQQWPDAADPTLALPAGSSFSSSPEDTGISQDDGGTPFGSLAPGDDSAARRVPQIIERGRLVVGVSQSMNQLGFRDPVTGDMAGFEVDIAHEIARDIFGDPDRVDFRYVDGTTRETALRDGDVDIIVRSMTLTRSRQTTVEYSAPYLTSTPKLLVPHGSGITSEKDLSDRTVCATRNSTNAQTVARDISHRRLLLTETWTDCLMAMQHQQVDAIYSDSAILSGLRSQDPNTELIDTGGQSTVYGVGAAAPPRRNTAGLVRQVNATLERIRVDGTWTRLYDRWLAPYMGPAVQPAPSYRSDADSGELDAIRRAAAAADAGNAADPSADPKEGD